MHNFEKFFIQPPKIEKDEPKPEILATQTLKEKKETKEKKSRLYSINEVNDEYELTVPAFAWPEHEVLVGETTKRFKTKEEAEQAAEQARAKAKDLFEKMSLEKSFTDSFYNIRETSEGKYLVTLPGLIKTKVNNLDCHIVNPIQKIFNTWQEAKEYYLQNKEDNEKLAEKPLLEVWINKNEKIAFSNIDHFNPKVAPLEQSYNIPDLIKKYLFQQEDHLMGTDNATTTYQETIKEKNWEKNLYSFISDYLKKDETEMAKQLKIKNLDSLTPKQAVELSTQIVIDLTKYKNSDTLELKQTEADQSSALKILREGQLKRKDPNWEGNGVCRNFAVLVKTIFEALKANQTRFSQLHNTYCLYETGTNSYAPKRNISSITEFNESGHAWNTFVTVSKKGEANATIVDVTWANRNLKTKKIEGLDYTLVRMEPTVNQISHNLKEDAPEKEKQLEHVLLFYLLAIENSGNTGGHISLEKEKQFYTTRALELITKQNLFQELPKTLAKVIGQEYSKAEIGRDMDKTELIALYKISQNNPDLGIQNILRNYVRNKQVSDYHVSSFLFEDDDLQKAIFWELKLIEDGNKLFENSGKFRMRIRELLPQLFNGFSPETKPGDASELKELAYGQNRLREYARIINHRKPSKENIENFIQITKGELKRINPQKYNEKYINTNNYELVKNFDKITEELNS